MNTYEKWFGGVVLVGVLFNLWFAIPSLFFPSYIVNVIGINPDFDTIWMRDAGMLLIAGSVFHALTARAPQRFLAFAWLVVGSRFFGAAVWFEVWQFDVLNSTSQPDLFRTFFIADLAFGVITGVLLYLGSRSRS